MSKSKCRKCGLTKDVSEFNFNKTKGRIEYHCKQCHSEYLKAHYAKNKQYYKDKAVAWRHELKAWYNDLKSQLSCKQCGQDHPAALDFHHDDPSRKEFTVGTALSRSWGKDRILKEIKKCTVLCSSCHRIFHWNEKYGP